jgi:F-type H+-transporting ATPase subunit a
MELTYMALGYFAFVLPVPLHFFFDLFVALIQTYVLMMLTIYIYEDGGGRIG